MVSDARPSRSSTETARQLQKPVTDMAQREPGAVASETVEGRPGEGKEEKSERRSAWTRTLLTPMWVRALRVRPPHSAIGPIQPGRCSLCSHSSASCSFAGRFFAVQGAHGLLASVRYNRQDLRTRPAVTRARADAADPHALDPLTGVRSGLNAEVAVDALCSCAQHPEGKGHGLQLENGDVLARGLPFEPLGENIGEQIDASLGRES